MEEVGELEASCLGPSIGVADEAGSPERPEYCCDEQDAPSASGSAPGDKCGEEDLHDAFQGLTTSDGGEAPTIPADAPRPALEKHPEVVDDFVRNFLYKAGLSRTLETFEAEWYDLKAQGRLPAAAPARVADAHVHNAALAGGVATLEAELAEARAGAARAAAAWEALRKERDVHRMHHKRVGQEKARLVKELAALRAHYAKYEPALAALQQRYNAALREKMLVSLERDRHRDAAAELKRRLAAAEEAAGGAGGGDTIKAVGRPEAHTESEAAPAHAPAAAQLPAGPRRNPYAGREFEELSLAALRPQKTFRGHTLGVAHVVLHPRKPVVATASDDHTWRLWHLPDGELIMSGEGHADWVAALDFHPAGACLASGSGDATVKVWDFARQRCAATLAEHTAAVWSVAFHDQGEFLASGSLDHSVRLWDVATGACRTALRGHADSVNEVAWLPYTNTIASASSDKTVSLWDARTGLAAATFFGHANSVNTLCPSLDGRTVVSADADGVLKVWDVRAVAERGGGAVTAHAVNRVRLDAAAAVAVAACDDGKVHARRLADMAAAGELSGHEDAVQSVALDPAGRSVVTAASDCTFRVWA